MSTSYNNRKKVNKLFRQEMNPMTLRRALQRFDSYPSKGLAGFITEMDTASIEPAPRRGRNKEKLTYAQRVQRNLANPFRVNADTIADAIKKIQERAANPQPNVLEL